MRLRTKLIVSFLLLAVVPLAGMVLFTYATSLQAFRRAVEIEARGQTDDLAARVKSVKSDLDRRVKSLSQLPFGSLVADGEGEVAPGTWDTVLADLHQVAPVLEALEFIPTPPSSHVPGGAPPVAASMGPLLIDLQELLSGGQLGTVKIEVKAAEIAAAALEGALGATAGVLPLEARRELVEEKRRLVAALKKSAYKRKAPSREAPAAPPAQSVLGQEFACPVERDGESIGRLRAHVSAGELLKGVLGHARRQQGEVPFAVDTDGKAYFAEDKDREALAGLSLAALASGETPRKARTSEDWIVVTARDPGSQLTLGIARPIHDSLREIRLTAARNFAYGLGLVALGLVTVVPLSGRMTRHLAALTEGAERLAQGDLETRVPVRGRDEIGQLSETFNRMAEDLALQRRRLLEEERRRKEQEVQQRLLEAENSRRGLELEEARRFQLSLLPRTLPQPPGLEVAVHMRTATEVGGDYYDFHLAEDGTLTAAIGDATGHGAKAGTMVTAIKSLFIAGAGDSSLAGFLERSADIVKRMEIERMTMALALVRIQGDRLSVSSAGMPPVLIHRAARGEVEEIALTGLPLGALAGSTYDERETRLHPGDTVLLASDGFPELLGQDGEILGYGALKERFRELGDAAPQEIVAGLAAAADAWTGGAAPLDDVTFVVLRREG